MLEASSLPKKLVMKKSHISCKTEYQHTAQDPNSSKTSNISGIRSRLRGAFRAHGAACAELGAGSPRARRARGQFALGSPKMGGTTNGFAEFYGTPQKGENHNK